MFAIIDTETSGGKYNEEKIIEIGILIYDGNKIIETFQSLINPQKKVDYFVQKLTGIKEKELKSCKTFKDHAKEIKKLLKNKVIVGHNVEYDYRVLKNEFKIIGIDYEAKTLCTIEMSKKIFPDLESYKLKKICNHFNIELKNHHRAYDDAKATSELFKIIRSFEKTN
tara:strand:+ start:235 stop:738 length:504 start_codon:yes stop_codon:yes gene_type:complete